MEDNILENEFHQYFDVFFRRRWVIISFFIMLVTTVTIATLRTRPLYRATVQLLIEQEHSNMLYREAVMVDISGRDYYQTQYRILKSRSLIKKVIDELNLGRNHEFSQNNGDAVSFLSNRIYVEPVKDSRLVNVSVESYSPELAAKISNTLAELYVKENLESKVFASRELLKKLPVGVSYDQISDKDILESLPSVVSSPLLQELKKELSKHEADYADFSKRYKEKHPVIISLKAKINQLNSRVAKEIRNMVESIRIDLSGYFKSNNVRIVDTAEIPSSPVKPDVKLNIMLACAAGLVMGCGLAFFFEYMDNTIKTGKDIESFLGIPFIGLMPKIKESERHNFLAEKPQSPASESLKLIRTNIIFSVPNASLKTLLITSAAPVEGKTFISYNLAAAFAQYKEKVLIVDSDLRRSSLTDNLKLQGTKGLSNYLIGESSFDEVLQATDIKNLSVISSGHLPPNPAELLAHDKMKEFLEEAKKRFGKVIIDSAPILPVSDTLNFACLVDGTVQVIFQGKLSRNILQYSGQKLRGVGAKILGAVLNNVAVRDYSYGYGYGYGYNKGYIGE